jgi:hypothetical protein
MTMQDPDDDDDDDTTTMTDEIEAVTPPLTVVAILADVDRQLADYPADAAPAFNDADDVDMTNEDDDNLAWMDSHVRSILAGADSRLFLLNTALCSGTHSSTTSSDRLYHHRSYR